MKWLVRRIVFAWVGEGNGWFVLTEGKSSVNVLVVFYRKLPMGGKYTSFGFKYQNILVRWNLLNHKDIFVVTPVYIRYVVVSIVLFTSMIAIELFYLTQLCSFLGFLFDYLPQFIPYSFAVYP